MDDEARRALEEAAARAWPPHAAATADGWVLRFSGGGSQRANSVLTLRWTGVDTEAAIEAAERAYRDRDQKPIFQIVDVSLPADLDARLAARGYDAVDRTLLMVKQIAQKELSSSGRSPSSPALSRGIEAGRAKGPVDLSPGRNPEGGKGALAAGERWASEPEDPCLSFSGEHTVALHPTAPTVWLDIYLATLTPDRRAAAPAIIAALPDPKGFFVASNQDGPFAVGLGMAEPPYCGVECMATRPDARRGGGARAVLAALEDWAAGQGATTLWLQVLERNAPARALYDSLGFQTVGSYWYRHAP